MKLFAVTEIRNVIVISSNFADFKGMTRNLQLSGRFEGAVDWYTCSCQGIKHCGEEVRF